jgi:glycosyltransferase involved in cell wall biosynthesis
MPMNGIPLVSICIPAYNSAKFIGSTITSILNQTFREFEIIITDDCSTDYTVNVVRSFSDPRIYCIVNEHRLGIGRNWNKAISLAKGKYVKLVCGDDILYPDCLSEQLKILEDPGYNDIVLVTGSKHVIDEQDNIIMTKRFTGRTGRWNGPKVIHRSIRFGTNILGEPAGGLFRREVMKSSGLFDDSNIYLIDLDFWSRILLHGDIFILDKVIFGFRVSRNSLSSRIGWEQVKLFHSFTDKLAEKKIFRLTRTDKITAKIMSVIMVFARNLVYLYLKNRKT